MRAHDVEEAVRTVTGLLGEHTGRDWAAPAGPLEWSCRETAVHVADDMYGYASQVAFDPRSAAGTRWGSPTRAPTRRRRCGT